MTVDLQDDRHRTEAILAAVRSIPPGHVSTYGWIARSAGWPRHARLVGRLLGKTVVGEVPWHRVVNAQGRISSRGGGESEQVRRLSAEGVHIDAAGRIDLSVYGWPGDDSVLE